MFKGPEVHAGVGAGHLHLHGDRGLRPGCSLPREFRLGMQQAAHTCELLNKMPFKSPH